MIHTIFNYTFKEIDFRAHMMFYIYILYIYIIYIYIYDIALTNKMI